MKDLWYGDNRDLIKWSVLFRLAQKYRAERILQIAYLTPSEFPQIIIDDQESDVAPEVIAHLRSIHNIKGMRSGARVEVHDCPLTDRAQYSEGVIEFISRFQREKCLVFLDPDIGLEPNGDPGLEHVLESEARTIWQSLKPEDVFVFYQHQTNRRGEPWIEEKKTQLEGALGVEPGFLKVAHRLPPRRTIAPDVVFYFGQKA